MDIQKTLSLPENRKLEFKREFPQKSNLLKTIVSFANGAGGEIFIGVSDKNRYVVGINDPMEMEEKISNLVYDGISPIISPFISIVNINDKKLLHISVPAGTNKPYFLKSSGMQNGTFVRIGSTNRKATTEIIEELKRQAHGYSYEEEIIPSLSINDLNREALLFFLNKAGIADISEQSLTKYHILKKNNGDYFPTVFSIALFGKEKLSQFDYMHIRLTRFNGINYNDISESKEFSLPLITKVDDIINILRSFVKRESVLEGARRYDTTIIPEFALREAVINAIVHRDYNIRSSSIKINVLDDRLEVISPGILFGNLDISDLGKGISESRNRRIVKIFRKLDYMEELGTGIVRILSLYEDSNLKKPQFSETGQFFKIVLPQTMITQSLKDAVYYLIKQQKEITAYTLEKELSIHRNTVLNYLKILLNENKITKHGNGKDTIYKINH
ncbi:putative DNA binding domain-containing protein [candidate division KSB1 bacterium]|nr:putative DNA binding domain-containing protein [candidate division KSB1 bacterium]